MNLKKDKKSIINDNLSVFKRLGRVQIFIIQKANKNGLIF